MEREIVYLKGSEPQAFPDTQDRIRAAFARYGVNLPNDVRAALSGYCAALCEWGLIAPSEHDKLQDMLPVCDDDPAIELILGFPDSSEDQP